MLFPVVHIRTCSSELLIYLPDCIFDMVLDISVLWSHAIHEMLDRCDGKCEMIGQY